MKYKNTYFEVSLNPEISVSEEEYNCRLNSEKLVKDIQELEVKITEYFKNRGLKYEIIDTNSSDIETILEKFTHREYSDIRTWLHHLIYYKKILFNINNKRFTKDHEQALNNHLNENASDGWKLLSMTPISKGLNYTKYGAYGDGCYGYGYGHDVLEGFVMVWEKME